MNLIAPYDLATRVAYKMITLLLNRKVLLYPTGVAFCVWRRGDRLIVAFNPEAIQLKLISDDFVHTLSTQLDGRLVVRTNSRGMYLQIGISVPPAPASLESQPLDFSQQPSPWHLPIGITKKGPLWVPLTGGISFLLGGSTGMGKTGEEHAWIQALLHGGKTSIYAWDGKHSIEFIRYADRPKFHLMFQVSELEQLQALLRDREQRLARSASVNILMHNEAHPDDFIPPIALFVDEAADLPDDAKLLLKQMIRIYRYAGLFPIIATNQPTQAEMFAKTNLSTRIVFRVPHHNDSITILGSKGAEALSDEPGRGLINWRGRLVEFQSFQVTYPDVSEEARQLISARMNREQKAAPSSEEADNAQILELIVAGETDAAIVRKLWGVSGGSSSYKLKARVKALRSENTSSSTSTTHEPVLGLEGVG